MKSQFLRTYTFGFDRIKKEEKLIRRNPVTFSSLSDITDTFFVANILRNQASDSSKEKWKEVLGSVMQDSLGR